MMFLLVFVAMTALDFVYAEWGKAVAERRSLWASGNAAVLILLSGFVTRSYVEDWTLLSAAACGAWLGTWLSIRFGK